MVTATWILPSQLPIARSRAVLMNTLVSASLDMAPYVWIENDRFVPAKLVQQAGISFPGFVQAGPRARI